MDGDPGSAHPYRMHGERASGQTTLLYRDDHVPFSSPSTSLSCPALEQSPLTTSSTGLAPEACCVREWPSKSFSLIFLILQNLTVPANISSLSPEPGQKKIEDDEGV